jgi:prepilin-type N-terminal cleavage/methylation domain-containing protein
MKLIHSTRKAFTLIEIMIVVAIMGIALTMGGVAIYHFLHPESIQKAVKDVMEACSHARAEAILQGIQVDLVIRPQDRQFQVVRVSAPQPAPGSDPNAPATRETAPAPVPGASSGSGTSLPSDPGHGIGFTAQLSDRVSIEMCDVNFGEYKDLDEARVHFYPNGTSDQFTLVLRSDHGDYRKISLEVVTALADVSLVQ